MSTDPPRTPWTDVLDQVRDALEDAGIGAGDIREEVVSGVGEALRALRSAGLAPDPEADGAAEPSVGVVEGGRPAGSPPTPGPRPDLHVAAPTEGQAAPRSPRPQVQVHVRTSAPLPALDGPVSFGLEDDEAQTLYRGSAPHPYRVAVDSGSVRLLLDGAPAETLSAGQSMDLDVAHLCAVAEHGRAEGRFLRLSR